MEGETPQEMDVAPAETSLSIPSLPTMHLPVLPTPFIGRERQVAEACALLDRSSVRLLTLAGPGGIGKTRLALAVASALQNDFSGGVHYVALASLTDPGLVIHQVAKALGIHQAEASSQQPHLLERLQELIGDKQLLLVLDNFEQVIDASSDLAALLSACPRLKVLVTSREVLRLSAEHSYSVPPMALPDLQRMPPFEFLARVEAVRMFVTRAQAAEPGFALTRENAIPIATICHRLDGLPLAIELAAARIRLLPPAQMLTRLEKRLSWLTGGSRDAPARHQTLRAAIDWSYDLLTPDEQTLFRHLTVFVGGCSLEAIGAVCDPPHDRANPEDILLEALASLVNKSLLRQRPDAPEHGRLYMLETIREYALEQLAASGEAGEVRRLHALYYVALAEEFKAKTLGPDQPAWLDRLEQEHDNLRAALNWAASTGNLEIWARLASSLWWFWLMRGYISEGRRWLDSLLVRGHSLPPVLKGQALNGAGRLAVRQGDYATAEVMLQESLAIKRALSDKTGEMDVLDNLGVVAIYQDDLASAQSYFEQSLPGWRSLGNKQGMITALNRLGLTMRYQNDFARAETLYQECLALAREVHSTYYVSAALHNMGHMEHHRGNDARAHALLVESCLLARQLGDRPNISVFLVDVAGVWAAQGQPERAARLFSASQVLRDNLQAIMYPAQRRAYERDLALAASQLDKEKWEAAWAEGRAMPFEDAFALAVEDLPSPPLPPSPADEYNLTERELEVLRLLVAGLTYAQIAGQLTVSFHTVHAHLRSIYGKLGVTSRNQATRFATEHHLV